MGISSSLIVTSPSKKVSSEDMGTTPLVAVVMGSDSDLATLEPAITILEDFKFVPGGRIMHGAGREDITTTLNNCYVVAVRDDSIKSIYDTIINEALTYKYGGGCGHDLSILRPSSFLPLFVEHEG